MSNSSQAAVLFWMLVSDGNEPVITVHDSSVASFFRVEIQHHIKANIWYRY